MSFSFCVRCTGRPDDLDGESTRRTRQHSDAIVEELELGVLWHEYGLVGDIVVRILFRFRFVVRIPGPLLLARHYLEKQGQLLSSNVQGGYSSLWSLFS